MAILPNNNIDTRLVGNAIGLGSDDIGQLHVRARSGGIVGTDINGGQYTSAFQFKETGSFVGNMGKRVDGAFPYWSIWANNQPGEWRMNQLGYGILEHWLKRDASNVPRFDMGDFRGHNTDASSPGINDVSRSFTQGQNSGLIKDYAIAVNARLGEYEWSKVSNVITHWQVRVMDGDNIIARSVPTPVSTGMATFSVVFPIIATNVIKKNIYESRVHLGNGVNDFTDIGYIPGAGEITIEIKKAVPRYTLDVAVDGVPGDAFNIPSDYGTSSNRYTFTCTYKTVHPSSMTMGKRLTEAIYKLVDLNTNTVKETLRLTSGFTDESPSSLDGWTPSFNRQIFGISSRRMIASSLGDLNEQVRVTLYYE